MKSRIQSIYRVLQNLYNKNDSEIVMIELYCCGCSGRAGYYFFQIRKGLGSSIFMQGSVAAKILQNPTCLSEAKLHSAAWCI